jgi:hypothetical protein
MESARKSDVPVSRKDLEKFMDELKQFEVSALL